MCFCHKADWSIVTKYSHGVDNNDSVGLLKLGVQRQECADDDDDVDVDVDVGRGLQHDRHQDDERPPSSAVILSRALFGVAFAVSQRIL